MDEEPPASEQQHDAMGSSTATAAADDSGRMTGGQRGDAAGEGAVGGVRDRRRGGVRGKDEAMCAQAVRRLAAFMSGWRVERVQMCGGVHAYV